MKDKKNLPQIITAILSILMLVFTLIFINFPDYSKPMLLLEKLGISTSGTICTVGNNTFSTNGTHETAVSIFKKISINNTTSTIVSFIILAILLVTALTIISKAASKTKYSWTAYLCAFLLPVMFCDITNTAFFKTLYINPLIMVLLLLICAVFVHIFNKQTVGTIGIVILTILTLLYSWLGIVQAVTAIVVGILIARLYAITKNQANKILAILMGCIIVVQSIVFAFNYKSVDYKRDIYNAVFFGVAKYDSVTELGLDPKLDDFKEVYYGMKENEDEYDLENTFYSKVSYKDIVKYYAAHPFNAYKVINYQAKNSALHYMQFGFTPYNFIKTKIPMNFIIVVAVTIVYILIAHILRKKYASIKYTVEFLAGISVMWLISLIVGSIYFGNSDMAMVMTNYNVLFDILLLSVLIGGTRVVLHRQDEKKEEFGITHE